MQVWDVELYRLNISKLVCDKSRSQLEGPQRFKLDKKKDSVVERTMFKNSVTNTVHLLRWPRSSGSRHLSWEVVTTIDTKLYVLVRITENCNDFSDEKISRLLFQVYDPLNDLWTILPNPPMSDTESDCSYGHFEWGHKIGVFDQRYGSSSYVFDTIEENWTPADGLPHLFCAVEFSGYLIGVEPQCYYRGRSVSIIVAYKLDDENGSPEPYSKHILTDDLWEIFYPPLNSDGSAFLTRFSDDHVLFLTTVNEFIVVAVFRVSISAVGEFPVVSAVFEHKQLYKLAGRNYLYISSIFLMLDTPGAHIPIRRTLPPIMLDDQPLVVDDDNEDHDDAPPQIETTHEQDDSTAPPSKAQTFDNKLNADVEWDAGLMEKSMYLCFVENRTDCSVSYIIKAIKFSDLISTSSHDSNSKLHQVASTSGFHLACLPCCGVFGSQILFAGGSDQDDLRVVQPVEDDCYSDAEDEVVVAQQVPRSRDIHFYDVINVKRSQV